MRKSIGIIGNGFVGSAIAAAFGLVADVYVYDIDDKKRTHTFQEVIQNSEFIFICVPTPMCEASGKIDLLPIKSVFADITKHHTRTDQIFIIKSTITPTSLTRLTEENQHLRIVFSPEFLTERSARLDFINSSRIVIGGSPHDLDSLEELLRIRFPYTRIIKTDFLTAQFIKYMANCFFATKVSFMNEMRQGADQLAIDWEKAMEGFVSDGRVGNSHLDVPGHDGGRGFGGKCFPKDINAFIQLYEEIGVSPTLMKAAWEKNLEVREHRDWLEIPGATTNTRGRK